MTHRLTAYLLLGLLVGTAHGERKWKLPVGKDTTLDVLVRVPAPAAERLRP